MQPIDLVKSHAAGGRIPQANYKAMYGLAAIIVAACAAIAWSFRSSPWMQDPTDLDARLAYVRDNADPGNESVDLLVLGSSRPAFGINSHDLAEAVGLRRDAAQNLAFPGFRPEAIVRQIEAAPHKMTGVKTWVIGIDDYYLLQEHTPAREESLLKRMEASMAAWLSPAMKLNAMGRELERNIGMTLGWKPQLSLDHWTMGADGSWNEPRLSTRVVDPEADRPVFQAIIDSYFKFSNGIHLEAVQDLEKIIAAAQAKGIAIVLVSMPYHSTYDTMAQSAYPGLFQITVNEVERIAARARVQFIDCRRSVQNCGVTNADFADPVHLNDAGATKLTAYLAKHVR